MAASDVSPHFGEGKFCSSIVYVWQKRHSKMLWFNWKRNCALGVSVLSPLARGSPTHASSPMCPTQKIPKILFSVFGTFVPSDGVSVSWGGDSRVFTVTHPTAASLLSCLGKLFLEIAGTGHQV